MEIATLHRHVSTKSYTLDLLWVCCFSAALSELPQWTVSVYLNRLCNTCTDQATLIYSFYWLFAWRGFSHTCSGLVSVTVFSSAPLSASLSGAVKHNTPKMAATLTLNWNESAHNFLKNYINISILHFDVIFGMRCYTVGGAFFVHPCGGGAQESWRRLHCALLCMMKDRRLCRLNKADPNQIKKNAFTDPQTNLLRSLLHPYCKWLLLSNIIFVLTFKKLIFEKLAPETISSFCLKIVSD